MDVLDFRPEIAAIQLALQGNSSVFFLKKPRENISWKVFYARTRLYFRQLEEGIFLKTAMETLSFTVHMTYHKE